MICSRLPIVTGALLAAWMAGAHAGAGSAALAPHLTGMAKRVAGVCCVPRGGDPALITALAQDGRMLVHAMSENPAEVAALRDAAVKAGAMGRTIYVEQGAASAIPLANWSADFVLVADATDAALDNLPQAEIRRIVSPYRGVVLVGRAKSLGAGMSKAKLEGWLKALDFPDARIVEDDMGLWGVAQAPPLEGADEWTHFQHDGGNNPVSRDTVLKPPLDIQFITPPFTGPGGSSRAAGGRFFEMEGQQYKHGGTDTLVGKVWCRNAYNGQILWEMDLPEHVDAKQLTAVAMPDAFYLLDDDKPGVRVIDPETGARRETISLGKPGEQCKWLAVEGGRLMTLIGKLAPPYPDRATYHGLKKPTDAPNVIRAGKLNHGLRVCGYDLTAKKTLWNYEVAPDVIDPRAIAAWDGKVAFLVEDKAPSPPDGKFAAEKVIGRRVVCLDAATGAVRWENKDARLAKLERQYQFIFGREYYPGMVASRDGVRLRLMGIYENDIYCFDPKTGATRWAIINDPETRKEIPTSFGGFFVDGKYYHSANVFDASSGELLEKLPKGAWDGGCGVRTWSPAGIFGNAAGNSTGLSVKSDCHMGSFVAGGLLHVPRGWCDCSPVWRGTFAFASRGEAPVHGEVSGERLTRGPAYSLNSQSPIAHRPSTANDRPKSETIQAELTDWPAYRHDNERTASSPVTVSANARVLWQNRPLAPYSFVAEHDQFFMRRQDQPTEPVAAGAMVFVGGSDGKVEALDGNNGKRVWTSWTGGPVYAPPTFWEGRVYAGSLDGFVYCLDARTGDLVWRFQAAPHDQRILHAMRLISRWPILTGVIVHDGAAYFAAGMADVQGVHVYALDARSGAVRWHNGNAGESGGPLDDALTPDGFMTVMGSRLFIRQRSGLVSRFHLATGARDPLPDYPIEMKSDPWRSRHFPMGREIAVLGDGFLLEGGRSLWHELNQREGDRAWPSFSLKRFGPDGALLHRASIKLATDAIIPPAFDAGGIALVPGGFGRYMKDGQRIESPRPRGTQGLVFLDKAGMLAQARTVAEQSQDFAEKYTALRNTALDGAEPQSRFDYPQDAPEMYRALPCFRWQFEDPWIQVNAVALAKNAVVITRGHQKTGEKGSLGNEYEKWTVAALARDTGKILWEHGLPCEPMLNGLCLDCDGRVIVTLRDGSVMSFGHRQD